LQNAIHLARRFEAQLFVLHVIRPISTFLGIGSAVDSAAERRYLASEGARLEDFLEGFDFHAVPWKKVVREGVPADMIIATAAEFAADLIIMGSVGRTGLSRILLGTVAGKVAEELPCSIVMVKGEDAIRLKLDEELSDLRTHYARGCDLLEHGFVEEAKRQFEHCIDISDMFAPAWVSLAESYQRQGDRDRAAECRKAAAEIEEAIAWRRVEADVRRDHLRKKRG
jgi:nucleotide-binding universal stress UspA family protein